jgi:hypothetical protein
MPVLDVTPGVVARTTLGALFTSVARSITETQGTLDAVAQVPMPEVPDGLATVSPLAFVVGSAGIEFTGLLSVVPRAGAAAPDLELALASRVDQTLRTAISTRVRVTIGAVRPQPELGDAIE